MPLLRRVIRYLDLSTDHGVLVSHLEPTGAAFEAGVREGDIIVRFGDGPIAGVDALHKRLTADRLGVPTPLTVVRGKQKLVLSVIPREAPRPKR